MEAATYVAEAAIERKHWWFVGRRRLFAHMLHQLALPHDCRILDAGTSTGANLRLLRDLGFTNVEGVDTSPEAIRFCASKKLGKVTLGDLCQLPFPANQFDLILATDVLEHLDQDSRALGEIYRVLKPGGRVLITVPAFPCMWGRQDEVAHHKRRYRARPLKELLDHSHFDCLDVFHFNYLLFVPIWLARRIITWLRLPLRSEFDVNTARLNRLLTWVFRFDVWSARWLRPPFGVSILAWCAKPKTGVRSESASTAA